MADGLLGFLSPAAGQDRRRWLNEQEAALAEALRYYLGPTGIPERADLANEIFNPALGVERGMTASRQALDPSSGLTGWERTGKAADAAAETLGALLGLGGGKATLEAAGPMIEDTLTSGARAVVDRLNQPGQMPTTYSNPIPGLLGNAAENTGPKLRLYQGSPHDFAAERLVRMPDGSTQYIVGSPDVLPDVPTGAEVLRDFPLGRARMDKIGTGEGAQAYGHGLYFTETPDIGRSYRDMGGDFDAGMTIGGKDIQDYYTGLENQAARMPAKSASAIYDQMALLEDLMWGGDILHVRQQAANGAYSPEAVAWFERNVASKFKNKRSLFEVNVNANPEDFLDWDAPLSAQPNVLSRLGYSTMDEDAAHAEAIRIFEENPNGAWMNDPALKARINELNDMLDRLPPSGTGQDLYRGGASDDVSGILSQMGYGDPAAQSQALRDAGIPGIRYLDAGSRGAGDGSRNYVVFDENLISIVRKYGIAGAAAMLGVSALDVEQAMAQGQQRPQGLLSMGAQ
jgi:hypothetical protein